MSIMLGNLTVNQIEERLGIALSEEERQTLNNDRQENANVTAKDKWHCFDIPFTIVCGSMDMAVKVNDILSPYASLMKEQIQISIDDKS